MRERIVLQSKCGVRERGILDNSRAHIVRSVHDTLTRLHTDHLDILLLHRPDVLVEPDEVAAAFDGLHSAGSVRYFGLSNHTALQIELLRKSVRQPLIVNQIRLGLLCWKEQAAEDSAGANTLDYCRVNGIQVQAYAPLSQSWNARFTVLKPVARDPPQVKRLAAELVELAKKYSVGPAAVMLAWLLRHPAQIMPVFGTTEVEHVKENCSAARITLTREEWYALFQTAALINAESSM